MMHRIRLVSLFVVGLLTVTFLHSEALGQSARPGMGAVPYSDDGGGVMFRVWAPNATSVHVAGEFNNWNLVTPLVDEGNGNWSRDVPTASVGQQYKYVIDTTIWKRDPRARQVTNSDGNSIIYDPNVFDWGDTPQYMPFRNDAVIYQMHVGTFAGQNPPSNFDLAIDRLDHVRKLGVNVIKLMPVNEFAGGLSWGYNPSDLFAIESDYGGPDALKRFVSAAHERNMAVYMDVVHNHYGPTDLDMWRFDGWHDGDWGGIYFYNDTRAVTPWGDTRPDFGRQEVRDFIRDQILMWVQEYRIGGFRWDSVFNIINTDWGTNTDGWQLLRDINWDLLNDYPHVIRGAEDNIFDHPMNFENVWDVGGRWDLHGQITPSSDASRDMNVVAGFVSNWNSHERVIFSEAHDYVAATHGRSRMPTEIDGGNPESSWARKRQLLAAGMVMTAPGVPMIFQGQEFNETNAFHDDTPLQWHLANKHQGITLAYSDLIAARRNLRGGMEGLKGTGVQVYPVDNANKVISYARWNMGGDEVLVVANFSANEFNSNNYMVRFPSTGTWYAHFNSDAQLYASDFGNIGSPVVEATGNPPQAAVNMGMYSMQIFSKTQPPNTGFVTFDPALPEACEPLEIAYAPNNGPLEGASTVVAMIGRNGWEDVEDLPMTWSDGAWRATKSVPTGTYRIDMVFHNGEPEASRIWDDNFGRDWWVPYENCPPLPSLAYLDPVPSGCDPVDIVYEARDDVLAEASAVFVHLARNGWQDLITLEMTETEPGIWRVQHLIPENTYQLNFVFHDGEPEESRIWDNNNGQDWNINITGCIEVSTRLAITVPDEDIDVGEEVSSYTVEGTTEGLAGHLVWTNQSSGVGGTIPVSASWSIPNIPLISGANLIRVTGTNDTVNPNASVQDSASDTVYTTANAWTDGQNGGTGFTTGWQLSGGDNAGFFLATASDANNDLGPYAWGLWANSGDEANAVRPFPAPLHVGDTFTLNFDNNWIDTDRSVGIAMQNQFGQNLFEFMFIGGGAEYLINDADGLDETGVGWTDQGLALSFELTSPTAYEFKIGSETFTGDLIATADDLVSQVRIWNFSSGGGWEFNLYVNDLAIDGDDLDTMEFFAERTITREGDVLEIEDLYLVLDSPVLEPTFRIHNSVVGRVYDLHYTTNLVAVPPIWTPMGLDVPGTGGPIDLTMTNTFGHLFIRSSVEME